MDGAKDKELYKRFAAMSRGYDCGQYVAVTKKACEHAKVEAEIELSHLERIFLRDLSGSNRLETGEKV